MKSADRIRIALLLQAGLVILTMAALELKIPGRILTVGILLLEVLLILWAFFFIYKPVRRIDTSVSQMENEDHPSVENLREAAGSDPFLLRIEELILRYSEELTRQNTAQIFDKQTELTALQSQINPHFLYNTLETIRGQALLDDNVEIARMTEALGAFFRYSISRKGTMVTLRDELANINNYMLIQSYRFNNRFSLEIIVDEEDEAAYDVMIPRLIIQPVVENAIFHGLEDLDENGRVTIEAMLTNENLILMISDNGKGIPEEELEKLNARIHSSDLSLIETDSGTHSTGIALPNIHKRIQLLFGEEYGVSVYSTPGQGTDVEILIPARTS